MSDLIERLLDAAPDGLLSAHVNDLDAIREAADTILGIRSANKRLKDEIANLLTALRRIQSLEEKNVPKYAQEIAREAISKAKNYQ